MQFNIEQINIIQAALNAYRINMYIQLKEITDDEAESILNALVTKIVNIEFRLEAARDHKITITNLKKNGRYVIDGQLTKQAKDALSDYSRANRYLNIDIKNQKKEFLARKIEQILMGKISK